MGYLAPARNSRHTLENKGFDAVRGRMGGRRRLAVPLSQLEPINDTDEETRQAIGDWHYGVARGYER